jgi:tetratricopeptide (TPR) repeat protein/O-antigen ligase
VKPSSMTSKLGRFSSGLIEAAWLVALMITPLFFNVFSSRIFEPDKVSLLRSLALLILGAWMVKSVDEGWQSGERNQSLRERLFSVLRTPLVLPVFLLAGVYVLSSILSIVPQTSFWGSYQRLQGTYTFFSYLVIFAAIAVNLRSRTQVNRLLNVLVFASLPIALYGVLQHYGLDPVPWGGNVQNRIAANMGNSIFVGAYLILIIPAALERSLDAFQKILREKSSLLVNAAKAVLFVFILLLDLLAVYFSRSRGPLVGLLAGLFFFITLWLAWYRQRTWLLLFWGIGGVAVLFLVLINIPGGPLESLRNQEWVGRYGQLLDMDQRTNRTRQLIWFGSAELMTPHEPLVYPNGDQDRLNFLRPFVGYGPESMYVAFNRFFPPELANVEFRNALPDRAHNETWDTLITTGLIGFGVYQALILSIFYWGYHWLGLINNRRQTRFFVLVVLLSGLISSVGFVFWRGFSFLGVALPVGIISGVMLYTIGAVLLSVREMNRQTPNWLAHLIILVLAIVAAHYVEIHFGISIVSTRLIFWVAVGLLLVAGIFLRNTGENKTISSESGTALVADAVSRNIPVERARTSRTRRGAVPVKDIDQGYIFWQRVFIPAGLLGVTLVTLGFNYIANINRATSAFEILISSFTRLPGEESIVSYGILALIVTTWLAGAVLLREPESADSHFSIVKEILLNLGLSGLIGLAYWIFQSSILAEIFRIDIRTQADVTSQVYNYGRLFVWYVLFILLLIVLLARFLPDIWPKRAHNRGVLSGIAVGVAGVLLLVFISQSNLRPIQADIAFKLADPFAKSKQWPGAILVYREAIKQAQNQDYYYLFLGRAYLEYAQALSDANERTTILAQAEQDLLTAQRINPLNTDHTANLARLYVWRGGSSEEQATRQADFERAQEYYATALSLSPNNVALWTELATLQLNSLKNRSLAFESIQTALDLDPLYDQVHAILGDYYLDQAGLEQDNNLSYYEQAADEYRKAFELAPKTEANASRLYAYRLALGSVLLQLGEKIEAAKAYQEAYSFVLPENQWSAAESIARLYLGQDDKVAALQWAHTALKTVPIAGQSRIQQLIDQINQSP